MKDCSRKPLDALHITIAFTVSVEIGVPQWAQELTNASRCKIVKIIIRWCKKLSIA